MSWDKYPLEKYELKNAGTWCIVFRHALTHLWNLSFPTKSVPTQNMCYGTASDAIDALFATPEMRNRTRNSRWWPEVPSTSALSVAYWRAIQRDLGPTDQPNELNLLKIHEMYEIRAGDCGRNQDDDHHCLYIAWNRGPSRIAPQEIVLTTPLPAVAIVSRAAGTTIDRQVFPSPDRVRGTSTAGLVQCGLPTPLAALIIDYTRDYTITWSQLTNFVWTATRKQVRHGNRTCCTSNHVQSVLHDRDNYARFLLQNERNCLAIIIQSDVRYNVIR